MTGYEAVRGAAAWFDATDRGRIAALGEDRKRLLHAMTTNQVQELEPGKGCYAFFLNAQGRILADAVILCRPDHLLLLTEPETRAKAREHLDRYIIADDVTLEDRTDSTAEIAVEGPDAARVLEAAGAPVPAEEYSQAEWDGWMVVKASLCGGAGFRLIGPAEGKTAMAARLEAAGAAAASAADVRTARIENGKPRYGEEITERYLPQETRQMGALSFSKGCYLGQEIVERVRSRGQIHRHLMPLEIDGRDAPEAGAKLTSGGKDAAEVVSAVFSPAWGKVAAMAYVRTDYTAPGSELDLGGRAARVR